MDDLTPLLSIGGIGTAIAVVVILVRTGVLHVAFGKKEEKNMGERFDDLEGNHLHTIAETLGRIERRLEKLDEIYEGIIFLKAKANGRN